MNRKRRPIRSLVIAAALGCCSTVAFVAAADFLPEVRCTCWVPPGGAGSPLKTVSMFRTVYSGEFIHFGQTPKMPQPFTRFATTLPNHTYSEPFPRWLSGPSDLGFVTFERLEQGWPMRCAWSCAWYGFGNGANQNVHYGSRLLGISHEGEERRLSYYILWPGLLINLALHTAAWWAALGLLPSTARSLLARSRRRRGLCTRCKYNLAGLPPEAPCPECGAPPPSARRAPQP